MFKRFKMDSAIKKDGIYIYIYIFNNYSLKSR